MYLCTSILNDSDLLKRFIYIMLNILKHYVVRNGHLVPTVCVACWNLCMKLLGNLLKTCAWSRLPI